MTNTEQFGIEWQFTLKGPRDADVKLSSVASYALEDDLAVAALLWHVWPRLRDAQLEVVFVTQLCWRHWRNVSGFSDVSETRFPKTLMETCAICLCAS